MCPDWVINEGNQIVLSARVVLNPGEGVEPRRWSRYDNRPLLPYIGKPGWILESPEYVDDVSNNIQHWLPCVFPPEKLHKLLPLEEGLYRMRWIFQARTPFGFCIYSSAQVRGKDLTYCHFRTRTQWELEPERWIVEVLAPTVPDDTGRMYWHWVRDTDQPLWDSTVAIRLRSAEPLPAVR